MKKITHSLSFWKGIAVLMTTPVILLMFYVSAHVFLHSLILIISIIFIFFLHLLVSKEFDEDNFINGVNWLGQSRGRNKVNIALNLIVVFALITLSVVGENQQTHEFPLFVKISGIILMIFSFLGWIAIRYGENHTWKTVFSRKNDTTCRSVSQLLTIVLCFILALFFYLNFASLYVWIPCIIFMPCALYAYRYDPKNRKKTNVKFFVVSAVLCFLCAIISTIAQFWSAEIFDGMLLWQLLGFVAILIVIFIFWAISGLLKNT